MKYIHSINMLAAKPSHQSPCWSSPEAVPQHLSTYGRVCSLLKAGGAVRGQGRHQTDELGWDPENTPWGDQ